MILTSSEAGTATTFSIGGHDPFGLNDCRDSLDTVYAQD
jgi:hypothetical protein